MEKNLSFIALTNKSDLKITFLGYKRLVRIKKIHFCLQILQMMSKMQPHTCTFKTKANVEICKHLLLSFFPEQPFEFRTKALDKNL